MSEREPAGGDAEFFSLMQALRALKAGPLSGDPSDRDLARAAGVAPTTVGDWLRGKRFPQAIDPVLVVVGMVRAAAEARGVVGSAEVPAGLLDDGRWRAAYQAEAQRRAGVTSDQVNRAKALSALTRQDAEVRDQAGRVPATLSSRRPATPGGAGFSRRAAILAGVAVLTVAAVVISAVIAAGGGPGSGAGAHPSSGGRLSVLKPPWTSGSGGIEETFTAGSPIRYAFDVYNSTGAVISANIRFDAYWGTRDEQPVNVFDILFQESIPPGRVTVYSPFVKVPGDALPGRYTEQADVADRNNPADRAGQYGSFNVSGRKLLAVPYHAQPSTIPPGGAEDGQACVVMILDSRPSARTPTVGDVQDFIAASGRNHAPASGASPVAGKDLEYALEHYGVSEAAISQISLGEPGLPQAQIIKMAIAIKQGSPVIALTDGKDLPAPGTASRSYTGHWLVVVGFGYDQKNGTEVLVNDPDGTPGHGGIEGQPIGIGTFEQALRDTATMPVAQQEPNNVAGIIVAPPRSS